MTNGPENRFASALDVCSLLTSATICKHAAEGCDSETNELEWEVWWETEELTWEQFI